MSASQEALRKWYEDSKKWEGIFEGKMPASKEEMRALMDGWSHFRQFTVHLIANPTAIGGGAHLEKAQSFVDKGCNFFGVNSDIQNLPAQRNLAQSLNNGAEKLEVQGPSSIRIGLFKEDFPVMLNQIALDKLAERAAEQAAEQATAERISQQRVNAINSDPFYEALRTAVLSTVSEEKTRISEKNPTDRRIAALSDVESKINNAIQTSKNERINVQNDISLESKESCKTNIALIIEEDFINNKAFEENWGTKFGKGLLNVLMAIPVGIKSLFTEKPASESFLSFKKELSLAKGAELKSEVENLSVDIKENSPNRGPSR
ncbi:hypothetical protein [Legionella geestiana]|nr:hypothetical protein [Legionella geestiana]QBS13165.1 hypothetical protein E4T54_10680 [Legionella geestiana]